MKTTPRKTRTLITVILVTLLGALAAVSFGTTAQAAMYAVTFGDKTVEGIVVARFGGKTHLLGRDGRLWDIPDKKITRSKKVSDHFIPFSAGEVRAKLLRELGSSQFEVSGTKHYLVAHPRGQRDLWARRFEELYRTFVNYFTVRGFELTDPPFPLVGIVCHNQSEFIKYSKSQGISVDNGTLGFYAHQSNRIIVFDVGKQNWGGDRWEVNYSTILHEATHQVSYNTGICSRLSPPPKWVSEGLAMYFEAPGVFDSSQYPTRADRINRTRLENYRQMIADSPYKKAAEQFPRTLVLSDEPFQTATLAAYAEAWAMTFYLIEKRPRDYARYLKRVSSNRPFQDAGPMVREVDFTSTFGGNWPMFLSRFQNFMEEQQP